MDICGFGRSVGGLRGSRTLIYGVLANVEKSGDFRGCFLACN